jgi:dihydrofolate reductase
MITSLIVAMTPKGIIGRNGRIPWKSSEDMKYFKETTMGFPVIMGRNTWDSLRIKPLQGRYNVVITRNTALVGKIVEGENGPWFHDSLEDVLEKFREMDTPEVFIIGGAQIYDEAISKDIVDQMYINIMKKDVEGDAWFPYIEKTLWQIEKSGTEFNDFDAYLYVRNPEPEEISPII